VPGSDRGVLTRREPKGSDARRLLAARRAAVVTAQTVVTPQGSSRTPTDAQLVLLSAAAHHEEHLIGRSQPRDRLRPQISQCSVVEDAVVTTRTRRLAARRAFTVAGEGRSERKAGLLTAKLKGSP
jgi:hypothetical protein